MDDKKTSEKVEISGYELDLDEVVRHYVSGMEFDDDKKSKVDESTVRYYVDPVSRKVLLYATLN